MAGGGLYPCRQQAVLRASWVPARAGWKRGRARRNL